MARFTGKRVLITGGTNGIGLAGARRIAAEGGQLVLTGTNTQRIAETQQALPRARVLSNDAGDPDDAQALAQAVAQFGGLDGLWLNAGYGAVAGVDEVDAEFFDQMMNTNVRGPVLQLAQLAEHLNQGASVVLTSSTATYEGSPMASVYAATKAALVALTRNWATALANRGIRVNVVVPGAIGTNFRGFMSEQIRESFETDVVGRVPLGRVGTAEEVAAVALFLLSDDASYVTASQYPVDGGLTKR
jgi:NAD(P)-dependent dehydrogenase (short-subunit alcohol dehydrogenase family)